MNACAWKWMKRGLRSKRVLWTLGALATLPVLALGYLWVGGVLLDNGKGVVDSDFRAYVKVGESSPGARAFLDISRNRYSRGSETHRLECRDLELAQYYANTVDRDKIDERGFTLDRFETDESFRRAWIAGLLASNQFVFAALDRAAEDADFCFADPDGDDGRTWQSLSSSYCTSVWEGPVLAQLRFDAESGDTAAMTAHFARNLRALEHLKGSGGQESPITATACLEVMVDGMSGLVDEYDFNVEDLARLDQILASAPVVQEADWHRARIREHVRARRRVYAFLAGKGSIAACGREPYRGWPDWLRRLRIRYAYQPWSMLDWMALRIAAEKAAGFDLEALKRLEQAWFGMSRARMEQWWRPGSLMCQADFRMSRHVRRFLEQRDEVQSLRKKIADRIELKRRGGTPVLKKHVFGRPENEEN